MCCTTYYYEANQCESQLPMIDGAVGAINASWRLVGRAEEDRVSSGCHGLTRKNKKSLPTLSTEALVQFLAWG